MGTAAGARPDDARQVAFPQGPGIAAVDGVAVPIVASRHVLRHGWRNRSTVEPGDLERAVLAVLTAAQVSVLVCLRIRIRRATPSASNSPTVSNQGVTPFDCPREPFVGRHSPLRIVFRGWRRWARCQMSRTQRRGDRNQRLAVHVYRTTAKAAPTNGVTHNVACSKHQIACPNESRRGRFSHVYNPRVGRNRLKSGSGSSWPEHLSGSTSEGEGTD